jgi:hypothetical protein
MLKKIVRKSIRFTVLYGIFSMAIAQAAPMIEALQPELVDVMPDRIFAPMGFDDNDNAQIVLDGEFPNISYRAGPVEKRIDTVNHKIYIRPKAYYYTLDLYLEVRTPYLIPVDLGPLPAGHYDVIVESPEGKIRNLANFPVVVAKTTSPDDYLYAPLKSAHLERTGLTDSIDGRSGYNLVLEGVFTNSCMTLSSPQVTVPGNNVIQVLPIVEFQRGSNCVSTKRPFSVSVSLKGISSGRYLVHIRSLNGQSINQIVDL